MRRCFNFTHRFTGLLLCACLLPAASSPARADCIVLHYRLPDIADEGLSESLARGLTAHLDWLHAHGVRLLTPDVDASEPAVCLQFSGPQALLDHMVRPLLAAWAAPAEMSTTFTPDDAIDLRRTLALSPTSPLGELIEGLSARGLHVRTPAAVRPR